ncbi:MAG: glycosyltransferase [Flavobacteriaceae bacterium]|nr:glycosyltransferase [Flavobacteriaceae bacterium]
MTIIHLNSSLAGGGAEQMVLQLSKKSKSSMRTVVISISSANALEEKFKLNDIEYHFLNINSFRNTTLLSGIKKLHAIIKDLPDPILHCHQYHGCVLGVMYKVFYKNMPMVFTLHSSTVDSKSRRLILYLTKVFRKKDIIFSENTSQWFLKNSAIIPNGIDFSEHENNNPRVYNSSEPFRFLYLGRLSPEKNPFHMIEVTKRLLNKGLTNFVIDVVGDGYLKEKFIKEIEADDLGSHIVLHGFQSDIKPFMDRSHCLVLMSIREGLPVVIIEAAANKLPIISTAVGSIPDFLNDSNAFVTDLDNYDKTMMHVIQNYNQAIDRSNKLYSEIKSDFSIDNVYERHLELYRSVMKSK